MQSPVRPLASSPSRASERGATTLEYAVLAALIFLVAMAGVRRVGVETTKPFEKVNSQVGRSNFCNQLAPGACVEPPPSDAGGPEGEG